MKKRFCKEILLMTIFCMVGTLMLGGCGKESNSQQEDKSVEVNAEELQIDDISAKSVIDEEVEENKELEMNSLGDPKDITQYLTFTASSTQTGGDYDTGNLTDGEISTAWVEGASDYGEGECIIITSDHYFSITGIEINNGYQKSDSLVLSNSQVKTLDIYSNNGKTETFDINQSVTIGDFQKIDLTTAEATDETSLTIKIVEVYQGSKYSDTCISELKVFGYIGDENPDYTEDITKTEKNTITSEIVTKVSMENTFNSIQELATITGKDNAENVVWKYEAASTVITELSLIQEIGIIGNAYYFNVQGTITALDISTGNILWENSDFGGASISYITDNKNNLYISGYYGPDLFVMDKNGKTLYRYETLSDYYWPYKLNYKDGSVYITYDASDDGVGGTLMVDPLTGAITNLE